MKDKLKVLTWNIGGVHTVNSNATFDYGEENLSYFTDSIKAVNQANTVLNVFVEKYMEREL